MSQEGFLGTPETALIFFRACRMFNITDVKERTALLRKLVARKKMTYIRDAKEFVQGKNVIEVRKKGSK